MSATSATSSGHRKRWAVTTAAVAASLTAGTLFAAPPATAATPEPATQRTQEGATVTAAELRQGIEDIKAAGIPYEVTTKEDGTEFIVFHFEEGDLGLNIPGTGSTAPADPGTVSPNFAVGSDSEGNFISFNHTDQVAIKNGTVTALLAGITLLSPPVGVIASVIVSFAGTYTNNNGTCPGNQELWVYYSQGIDGNPLYEKIVCRPVSYPGGG